MAVGETSINITNEQLYLLQLLFPKIAKSKRDRDRTVSTNSTVPTCSPGYRQWWRASPRLASPRLAVSHSPSLFSSLTSHSADRGRALRLRSSTGSQTAPPSSALSHCKCPPHTRTLSHSRKLSTKTTSSQCLEGQLTMLRVSRGLVHSFPPLPQNSLLCDRPVNVHVDVYTVLGSHFIVGHFPALKTVETQ